VLGELFAGIDVYYCNSMSSIITRDHINI
jgi:hypothetical protein